MAFVRARRLYVAKARSKVRATPARIEALGRQMSEVYRVGFIDGANKLRARIDKDKLMDAFKKGNYKPLVAAIPYDKKDITEAFKATANALEETITLGAKTTIREFNKTLANRLEYNPQNDRTRDYIDKNTSQLAQKLTEEMRDNIKSAVQGNLVNGTPIDEVAEQIRQSVGLNVRQNIALQNFKGTPKDKEAYKSKLLDDRAMMLARTETAYAQNESRLQVWDAAQDQGLISQNATKVWMVDGAPCDICEPMDGQEVSLDEPFVTDDGEEVYAPPLHVNCLCLTILGKT